MDFWYTETVFGEQSLYKHFLNIFYTVFLNFFGNKDVF